MPSENRIEFTKENLDTYELMDDFLQFCKSR